jgi:hypothetical protein
MSRISMMLGLAWIVCGPQAGFGQDELHRQLGPGVVAPYYGANLMERYNYYPYAPLYLNWDSQRFHSLVYMDRMDRLEKFGDRWPSAKYGTEFQVNRIQNEYAKDTGVYEDRPRRGWFSGGVLFGRWRR